MIFCDIFEPTNIETIIQQSVPTYKDAFNNKGFPDYTWIDTINRRIGVSRKKLGELLSSIDATEEQLGRDMESVDELILLIEDCFYSPILYNNRPGIQTWIPTKDGKFIRQYRKYNVSVSLLDSWLYQLSKAGISHIKTFDYEHTASCLVSLYHSSQKLEHSTLRRYIKPKMIHRDWNPQVLTLMGVYTEAGKKCRTFLGEKKAKALIDRYGTVWEILNQDAQELAKTENIGIVDATKLLKAIGKIRK